MQDYKRLSCCTLARIAFVLIILIPAGVFAAEVSGHQMLEENPALFNWLFGGCILLLGWFMNRTVSKLDRNNVRVWLILDDISKRLATLEGTCSARQESLSGGRRGYDPDTRKGAE